MVVPKDPGRGTAPAHPPTTLTQWLGTRSAAQIATVLTARPDACLPPVPRDLGELADRLETFASVADAVHHLPRPAVEVVEVLQLLGPDGGDRATLAGWLGCPPDSAELTMVLDLLASRALTWPDGDRLRMAAPMYATMRHPLALGPPAAVLLSTCPAPHLRKVARTLGIAPAGANRTLVTEVVNWLSDGDQVRQQVAEAPQPTRAALHRLAADGPTPDGSANWYGYHRPDPHLDWAVQRGLVVTDHWGAPQMPREVAVALRGRHWHAPFTPHRPAPDLVAVAAATVDREAAAAGSAAVEQVTALVEAIAARPVAVLKAGGVGARELRRLAKLLGSEEATVRLWLELAHHAGLISPEVTRGPRGEVSAAEVLPTAQWDRWAAAQPPDRLAALLRGWLTLRAAPLLGPDPDDGAPPAPALVSDYTGHAAVVVREHLLALLAGLPSGHGVGAAGSDRDGDRDGGGDPAASCLPALCWESPLLIAGLQHPGRFVSACWQEAGLLGVIAHGVLTALGRSLVEAGDDQAALEAACRKLLPPAVSEAIFQTDLTVLVPGAPAAALAELLDAAAERESRGGATTWRFTTGSVRRALDTGHEADELVARLRAVALGNALPQPLEYLISDLARRHGAIRVRPVACVLRAEEPALLTEIAGTRALRALGLCQLAPTVLGSTRPVTETLAALRASGYAPVAESADGAPVLERVPRRRAGPPAQRRGPRSGREHAGAATTPPNPLALATTLLAAAPGAGRRRAAPAGRLLDLASTDPPGLTGPPEDGDDLPAQIDYFAVQLGRAERRLLAHAIENCRPIRISYTNAQGNSSVRVVDPIEFDGAYLLAHCRLRDDERMFALDRIDSVAPV